MSKSLANPDVFSLFGSLIHILLRKLKSEKETLLLKRSHFNGPKEPPYGLADLGWATRPVLPLLLPLLGLHFVTQLFFLLLLLKNLISLPLTSPFVAVCPWASYLTPLSLYFLR